MDIDTTLVAATAVAHTAPFLPLLLETVKFSANAIGELIVQKGGEAAYHKAKSIWERISDRYENDGLIVGAATMLAAQPDNQALQTQLASILAIRLQTDDQLASRLIEVLGGKTSLQEVIAERNAWIEQVRQQIHGASGKQMIRGEKKSKIKDIEQTISE